MNLWGASGILFMRRITKASDTPKYQENTSLLGRRINVHSQPVVTKAGMTVDLPLVVKLLGHP